MARTMDSPKLRKLPRSQIQSIAKRELVRAVGKTEDIIRRLVKKHPDGVPVSSDEVEESTSQPARKKNVLRKPRKGHNRQSPSEAEDRWEIVVDTNLDDQEAGPSTASHQAAPVQNDAGDESRSQNAIREEEEVPPQQIVHTVSHDAIAAGPSAAPSQQPSHDAEQEDPRPLSAPSEQAPSSCHEPSANTSDTTPADPSTAQLQEPAPTAPADLYTNDDYPRAMNGPDENMVVDVLRQFTTLVNTIPVLESRIVDVQRLLDRTTSIVQEMAPDLRESCMAREHLELFLLGKMKKKRELWDGTAKMSKQARKLRVAWLRAERKAENVRRWQEENESYAKRGLSPEPYEYYASESEDEIIESLQTTPASSICGSPKRQREDPIEAEGGRKKRRRS
ncbi:hypothetical protein F5I97DRAFT_1930779 [Phlebopus sp. FC_14]|nr:hypothetical protein F5I97DRAFT_1930779 [Phlebopus sp. FC_14]